MKRGVVWIPDWPVVAAQLRGEVDPAKSLAVAGQRGLVAVNGIAREHGLSVGMRKRTAQSIDPDVQLIKSDDVRDVLAFDPVIRACEEHISDVVVLEPGTLTFLARGPIRTAGSVSELAEALVGDIADVAGVEAHVGFGEGLLTALLAARYDADVPDAEPFLDGQRVEVLMEACFSAPAKSAMEAFIGSMNSLGIRLLGDLRRLDRNALVSRFGAQGQLARLLAEGKEPGGAGKLHETVTCTVSWDLDEPLQQLDQAAFIAREMAEDLLSRLTGGGKMAREFTISARTESGTMRQRTWCVDAAGVRDVSDRVRWQLSAWLREADVAGEDSGVGPDSGIVFLGIDAGQLYPAGLSQGTLWGGNRAHAQAARRAVTRIQSLLDDDAVVVPHRVGGRAPLDAYKIEPWDAEAPKGEPDAPWPGSLPRPWPATVLSTPAQVRVLDSSGHECQVSALGVFYCDSHCLDPRPHRLVEKGATHVLASCVGPWLHSEGWWNPHTQQRKAWCEAVDAVGEGLLFHREGGSWWLTGRYT